MRGMRTHRRPSTKSSYGRSLGTSNSPRSSETPFTPLRALSPRDHRQAEPVLLNLLDCHGVDLAMASTFLRFQNADVFQIVDRPAYRAVFGKRFPVHSKTPPHTKVSIYFKYLDSLHSLAAARRVAFREARPDSVHVRQGTQRRTVAMPHCAADRSCSKGRCRTSLVVFGAATIR
jgi:hypothetical protein